MYIYPFKEMSPNIHPSVYIADGVVISGDVAIEEDSSIWFHTVIRGDVDRTTIGKRVNIQDLSMIHQSPGNPIVIEDDVSVGHQVTLHGCTIKKGALVGMKATVLDGAEVGEEAFIGAGASSHPGRPFHKNLALGSPARVVRELSEEDLEEMKRVRDTYVERGKQYRAITEKN
ncbi:LOW QUALITY PROTEIN: carbonic anhydrase, family 3 [Geomicrobium sp. JCM 19039]|nr:LOW QUALITY PROTEIN: carbonic anhydrase, family 3 [Geomicrobium sp. JCM 19039]